MVTWRTRVAGVALAVFGMLMTSGCWHKYVVPTGEVDQRYSEHSLQGRITALDGDNMTVQADAGGSTTVVTLTSDTRLLKAGDGLVLRPELMSGHRVRVWYGSPKQAASETGPHVAVAVMLASLDPKDEWPTQ